MKTFTLILTLFLMISTQSLLAQKVVVIGINHNSTSPNTDGFSFLAAENLLVGDIIYFTENEYSDAGNAFVNLEEGVVAFTVTSAINTGNVVFISETGTSTNTFSVSSSSGNGTAVKTNSSGSFSIASGGESLYAYSDVDEDPSNGVTEIYSVLCTGSGEIPTATGGNIPADLDPTNDYANAVVVDGFTYGSVPDRLEYNTNAGDRTNVNQTMLENPTNYTTGTAAALSTQPFTNFSLSGSNPVLTVSASPASVNENSGSSITYTFSLSANATSNITVNFSVGGTASYSTDYTQSGAATFNASSGTVTISSGTNSADITITPVGDAGLEPNETVVLTLNSGTGYDAGSPSSTSGTIINDDTQAVTPLVAITGTNQNDPEGFSFVALDDISSGTEIYFTENSFDNSSLAFSGTEAVLSWTSPGTDVLRGEVIVVKEDPAGTFTASSQSGNSGSISLVSGTLSFASTGEQFYAYTDSDNDPTNGVTEVHSVLFTGTTTTSGGNIPSSEDPSTVFIGAVVVDGFAATSPNRTEYDPAKRNVTVDNANFQNVVNWLHAQANQDLSEVPFSNVIITTGSANPTVTLAVSPSDIVEDAGDTLFYTFTLSAPASGDITVNFDVSGSADFSTDYTVDGANSFSASSGSAVIANGTSTAVVSVVPVVDSDVETQESVQLILSSGTGYDGGSPNDATGTISNDDTSASDPLVAITGLNHESPDGFSFVAAQDIPASSTIYFTDNSFDNTKLMFSSGEAVLSWTSPASVVPAGQVIVVTETSPDVFSVTRSNGSTETGSITLQSGNLALATDGETFYAYDDDDNDPTNGVVDIYSVLYTGVVASSGGSIPATEDPSGIYTLALVVDGFPATTPNRTEYDPAKRNVLVNDVDFEDISNWLHAQANQTLSTVPFDNLNILNRVLISVNDPSVTEGNSGTTNLTFTVSLSQPAPAGGATVDYATSDGTAVSGSDYTLASGTLTFTAGETSKTVDVTVTGDQMLEADETISLTLSNPTGTDVLISDGTGTGTITNDDAAAVSIIDVSGNEDDGAITLTATLDYAVQGGFTVDVSTADGTATTADGDYTAVSGQTLTFAGTVGETQTFTVTPSSDTKLEADETLTVSQSNLTATILAVDITDEATVTINNDDAAAVTIADVSGNEDDGAITITATLDNAVDGGFTLDVSTADGTATTAGGDYTAVSGQTLTFAGTAGETQTFTVTPTSDTKLEAHETLTISQSNLAATSLTVDITDNATVTINNDDAAAVTIADVSANEDDGAITVTASLDYAVEGGFTVDVSTADGTATTADNDYTAVSSQTLSFTGSAGETQTFTVTPTSDANYESNETLLVNQSNVAATTLAVDITDGATVTIINDDYPPLEAKFDLNPQTGCSLPHTVFFTDQSAYPDTWLWNFGDGNTSTAQNPIHTYTSFGSFTITLTITDTIFGISDTAYAEVVVGDVQAPTISCPGTQTVYSDSNCQGELDDYTALAIVSDLCDPNPVVTQSPLQGTFFSDSIEVTLFASDASGNIDSCKFTVVTLDTISPQSVCQNFSVYLDENGSASLMTGDVDNGSSDNCGIDSMWLDNYDFNCSSLGDNIVTMTVLDIKGNSSNCQSTITVIDTTKPVTICTNISIGLNQNGKATITASQIDGGSTDNCGVDSIYLDRYDFTAADIGGNPVTLYVEDASGNVSSCTATVTVGDNIPPVVKCNSIQILYPGGGNYVFSKDELKAMAAGSKDNATPFNRLKIKALIYPKIISCNSKGAAVLVEIAVTDEAGNKASCRTFVQVIETMDLMIDPINDVEINLPAGMCETSITYPELNSPNLCTELTHISGLGPEGVFPVGTTEEKWLLSNSAGDSLEFSFNVIVTSDNIDPTLDPIADIDTMGPVSELIVSLSGVSYGADCAEQEITVTALGTNSDVVSSINLNYTSPAANGELVLSIPAAAKGSDTITVTVEDSEGGIVSETFVVTIDHTNQAPIVMNALSDRELIADREIKIPFKDSLFVDNDGDSLLIEFALEDQSTLPAWFEVMNDTLYITPSIADTGCISVVITATDPSMASVSDTFAVCVKGFPVSVGDINSSELSLNMFPNPSKGLVTLEFDAQVDGDIEVLVTDIAGKQILKKSYLASKRINLNLSDQVSGMYLVNVQANGQNYMRKLILNKR